MGRIFASGIWRAYLPEGLFTGGLIFGGVYYRNFTVSSLLNSTDTTFKLGYFTNFKVLFPAVRVSVNDYLPKLDFVALALIIVLRLLFQSAAVR